uniref:Uncharacterized protein n=1 Tax=Arundo donax TaxID=35708 RepID=A0A0A9HVE2_ARUDO
MNKCNACVYFKGIFLFFSTNNFQ